VRESFSFATRGYDLYRESEIVVVWQRNTAGVTSGRSGSGTVSGTEIVKGTSLNYEGISKVLYRF